MAFDFNALLNNPAFRYGATLLGSSHEADPFSRANTALQQIQEAQKQQQLVALEQQKMQMEQTAHGFTNSQHEQETRKLKTINDLLAQAVQARQLRQGAVQSQSGPTQPQADMGPQGQGLQPPQGYNWQGQSVNPFNGFTTPGQNRIGATPDQGGMLNAGLMNTQQQPQQGQDPNEMLPALNPDAEMWALAGNKELAKLYQQAYGQNFLPNGMAYGHTRGGGVAPVPGSYENLQRHEEMIANIKRSHEQVSVPISNGKETTMSGLEADAYYRTGQLPQRVIDQFGLPQNPAIATDTPAGSYASAYAPTQKGGAPASLHQAVISTESGGNRNAVSPVGAKSEMQVMDKTNGNPGYGVKPAQNGSLVERARVGHDYLDAMHARYQEPALAAIAYNMGPEATDKWLTNGGDYSKLPQETKNYVGSVMTKQAVTGTRSAATNQPSADTAIGMKVAPQIGVKQSPAEAAQANIFAETGAKQFLTLQTNAKTAQTDIGNMKLVQAYLSKIGNTGMAAPAELSFYKMAQGLGFQIPAKASYMEGVQGMTRQFAMKLRNPAEGGGLPGQMSNYEDRLLQSMAPNIEKLPNANKILVDAFIKQKQRTIEQAKLSAQWKAQGVPLDEIDQRLVKHAEDNPFFTKEDEAKIMGASGQGRSSISSGDARGASGDWESSTPANGGVKFLGFE